MDILSLSVCDNFVYLPYQRKCKTLKKHCYDRWMHGLQVPGYSLKVSLVLSACPSGNIKVMKNVSTFLCHFGTDREAMDITRIDVS